MTSKTLFRKRLKAILILVVLSICMISYSTVSAEEKSMYVVVANSNGEVAAFNTDSIKRQYISDEKWVFEMKGSGKEFSYPINDILPFMSELRDLSTGTEILHADKPMWYVYGGEGSLTISNPNNIIGEFAVYTIEGQMLISGYEGSSKKTINIPKHGIYIVKIGHKSIKYLSK